MFYHNQSETSEFTTPIGYIMILKSSINPQHIKNKMNILKLSFVFLLCFPKVSTLLPAFNSLSIQHD